MPTSQYPNAASASRSANAYGPSLITRSTIADLDAACADAQAALNSVPPTQREAATQDLRRAQLAQQAAAAANSGHVDTARELMLAATTVSGHEVDYRILFAAFQLLFRIGEPQSAEQLVLRRLRTVPSDSAPAARAYSNLGLIQWSQARMAEATESFREAIRIDEQLGDQIGLARDIGNLAMVPESQGDLDAAESLYLQALAIAERMRADDLIATKLANLGDISLQRGRIDEARTRWTRAVALLESTGSLKAHAEYAAKLARLGPPGQ